MGDWAYGEVVAKNAQDNIGWVSHPGTAGSFVLVVDSFTLPVGAPHAENATNWLKILGSKEAQEAFNPLKGSIPPRTDVNRDIFSPYHQWSMDGFAKDALVPSCAHGQAASPAFKQALLRRVDCVRHRQGRRHVHLACSLTRRRWRPRRPRSLAGRCRSVAQLRDGRPNRSPVAHR